MTGKHHEIKYRWRSASKDKEIEFTSGNE